MASDGKIVFVGSKSYLKNEYIFNYSENVEMLKNVSNCSGSDFVVLSCKDNRAIFQNFNSLGNVDTTIYNYIKEKSSDMVLYNYDEDYLDVTNSTDKSTVS